MKIEDLLEPPTDLITGDITKFQTMDGKWTYSIVISKNPYSFIIRVDAPNSLREFDEFSARGEIILLTYD